MFLLYFRLLTFSDLYWVCLSVFSCTVLFVSISHFWLAVKTASEMTYIVSSGALKSTPTPTPVEGREGEGKGKGKKRERRVEGRKWRYRKMRHIWKNLRQRKIKVDAYGARRGNWKWPYTWCDKGHRVMIVRIATQLRRLGEVGLTSDTKMID